MTPASTVARGGTPAAAAGAGASTGELLCDDIRREIVNRAVADSDMCLTVIQYSTGEVLFSVHRNMLDPAWHVHFTQVRCGQPLPPMLFRTRQALMSAIDRCTLDYVFWDEEDSVDEQHHVALYCQGVRQPPVWDGLTSEHPFYQQCLVYVEGILDAVVCLVAEA